MTTRAKKGAPVKKEKTFATKLTAYMVGEGKGPHDAVTLDDIIHAEKFGGAAPNAKKASVAADSED